MPTKEGLFSEHLPQSFIERLFSRRFDTVLISEYLSIPQVVAGFIYQKVGILTKDCYLVPRQDRQASLDLKQRSLPLIHPDYLNPRLLEQVIDHSRLNVHQKGNLRRLALFIEAYRPFPAKEWWKAGEIQQDTKKIARKSLHQYLATILLAGIGDPFYAYKTCLKALDRLVAQKGSRFSPLALAKSYRLSQQAIRLARENLRQKPPLATGEADICPITLTVPFLKSAYYEPDRIEYGQVQFDYGRLRLLKDQHWAIAVGGSPQSGKSTLSVSLCQAMEHLVGDCVERGIIDKGQVRIGLCDLDVWAPTASYLASGQEVQRADRAERQAHALSLMVGSNKDFRARKKHDNVIVADLPGGKPDIWTQFLANPCDFSVIVDKDWQQSAKGWQDFLLGFYLPRPVVGIHTRFGEEGRQSGIRFYQHRSHSGNFVQGRVVNLARQPVPDDPVVNFVAHVLLFDYLPQMVTGKEVYRYQLAQSLGLI